MSVETFVAGMWATALAGSAAIVAVLAARAPLRRLFGAGLAYAAWAMVPLAVLAALLPGDARPALPALALPQVWVGATQTTGMAATPVPGADQYVAAWLCALWLLGATAMAVTLWRQQRRYRRSLGQLSPGTDGVLYAQHALHGPLVLGAWRPRIVVPLDFAQRYPTAQAQLVLDHERTHIARGDTRHNLVLAALRCVYWFNPLLHWAAARFRFDQELACDAAVLARHPASRRSYAEAMLQTQLDAIALPVGCHWQAGQTLRQRIALLQRPAVRGWRRRAGIAVVATLALCGATAAWALQPLPASSLASSDRAAGLAKAQVADTAARAPGEQTHPAPAYAWAAAAAAAAAKPGTTPAKPLAMDPPAFPREALRKGVSGKVLLLVDVDTAGRVSDVALSGHGSGDASLDKAAMAAARLWRFVPAKARGRAIASRLEIPVNFDLGMQPTDAPPGMANAARYNWYLLDTDGDPREYTCDIVYTTRSLGGRDPVYCGFAVKVATR